MEMLERILATLIGFVVMMAVSIWLTLAAEMPACASGPMGFIVFLLVYRAVRFGARQLRERQ